jgi:hypothetical protein
MGFEGEDKPISSNACIRSAKERHTCTVSNSQSCDSSVSCKRYLIKASS